MISCLDWITRTQGGSKENVYLESGDDPYSHGILEFPILVRVVGGGGRSISCFCVGVEVKNRGLYLLLGKQVDDVRSKTANMKTNKRKHTSPCAVSCWLKIRR